MAPSQSRQQLLKIVASSPVLRSLLLGWAAQSLPQLIRTVVSAVVGKRTGRGRQLLRRIFQAAKAGVQLRGLGVAFAVAVGGAQLGEGSVTRVVEKAYFVARRAREGKGKARETDESLAEEQQRVLQDIRNVQLLSTFLSASISSLFALLLLQSSPRRTSRTSPDPALDFTVSPYTPAVSAATSATSPTIPFGRPPQSPTLDLTLFLTVRAADTLIRGLHSSLSPPRGRFAPFLRLLSHHSDTLTFFLSSHIIMRSWFYAAHLLPPQFGAWILQLARMDPALLELLRFARAKRYVYGKEPDAEVVRMCEGIAQRTGVDVSLINPAQISRLSCTFVHLPLPSNLFFRSPSLAARLSSSCEFNALSRFLLAFLDAFKLYLPVHALPPLLFSLRRVLASPSSSLLRILVASLRSSAFLATFVSSIYAAVCLVRTRLPQISRGRGVSQQGLDGGLCVLAGTLACGGSILIESKKRRREMALFVAPRALYALLDSAIPVSFLHGKYSELFCRWVERVVFCLSSGTVLSAAVHRPELVSGVVRGVTSFVVAGWKDDPLSTLRKRL